MNTIHFVFLTFLPLAYSFRNLSVLFNGEYTEETEVFDAFSRMYWNASNFLYCALIDVEDISPERIVESSPLKTFCPYILSNTGKKMIIMGGAFINFPAYVFVFAQNHIGFEKKIMSAIRSGFYKPRIRTIIILTKPVSNLDFLPGFMTELWLLKLYRFNIILFHRNLQVFTYNPFLNLVVNITHFSDINIINNQFRNLHLYRLRMVLYEDPPDCFKKNNEWYGREKLYWQNLFLDLNATAEVIETSPYRLDEAKYAVKSGMGDLCPLRYFRTDVPEDLDFSAPYSIERLVVLVPNSRNILRSTIGFSSTVWNCLLFAIISIFLSILTIEKISPTAGGKIDIKYILDVMGICVGRSIVNKTYFRYNWIQKGLLMLWQAENVVLIAAFECALISTLVLAKFDDQIDTIEDLVDSNLTIYVIPEYVQMIEHFSPRLKPQIVELSKSRFTPFLIEEHFNNQAVALPDSEAHPLLTRLNANRDRVPYRVMGDALLPGFFSFFFTRNSPFVKMVDRMVLSKYQFGLNRRSKVKFDPVIRRSRNSYTPLSLRILENVFKILLIGLCLSVVCILLEVFVNRRKYL